MRRIPFCAYCCHNKEGTSTFPPHPATKHEWLQCRRSSTSSELMYRKVGSEGHSGQMPQSQILPHRIRMQLDVFAWCRLFETWYCYDPELMEEPWETSDAPVGLFAYLTESLPSSYPTIYLKNPKPYQTRWPNFKCWLSHWISTLWLIMWILGQPVLQSPELESWQTISTGSHL